MKPLISVVIAAHGEGEFLPTILGSLQNQRQYATAQCTRSGRDVTYGRALPLEEPLSIEVIICWDGADKEGWFDPIEGMSLEYSFPISQIGVSSEEGSLAGHHTRAPGIAATQGEWIVLTNQDNYFVSGWYWTVMNQLVHRPYSQTTGMYYWDIVSNLWAWGTRESKLAWGQIDLNCVIIRADIAKAVGFPWRNYDADWNWIEMLTKQCKTRGLRTRHLPYILSVHN